MAVRSRAAVMVPRAATFAAAVRREGYTACGKKVDVILEIINMSSLPIYYYCFASI